MIVKDQSETITFRVHGVMDATVTKLIVIDREPVKATVPCLEVQLVADNEYHGSFTLRFVGAQRIADARLKYKTDAEVEATFAAL